VVPSKLEIIGTFLETVSESSQNISINKVILRKKLELAENINKKTII